MSALHLHDDQCLILARARLRTLRAESRLSHAIIQAHREYIQEIDLALTYLETNITRSDVVDAVRSPSTPSGTEASGSGDRRPLGDITNTGPRRVQRPSVPTTPRRIRRRRLPTPPLLRRQDGMTFNDENAPPRR
jgi:hypothetical protein